MREATQIWRPSRNEMENMNKFNFFFVFRNFRLPRGFLPFYNNAWHNLAQTKNASVLQQPVRSEKITKSEVTTIRSIIFKRKHTYHLGTKECYRIIRHHGPFQVPPVCFVLRGKEGNMCVCRVRSRFGNLHPFNLPSLYSHPRTADIPRT